MLAARTDHGMLAFGLWQAKDGAAGGAFFVDMCLTVAELVASQAEKGAELLIFAASRGDISREHTREHPEHE